MGCDIHFYVERKDGGKWVPADKWIPNPYPDEGSALVVDYDDDLFYSGRNYELFAILAGVRNRSDIIPIAPPRGVPADACAEVAACSKAWDADGHSHSWFTLSELLAHDWTQTVRLSGWVSASEYAKWMRWEKGRGEGPSSYCQGVGGGNVEHASVEEMDQRIAAIRKPFEERAHTRGRWNAEFEEAVAAQLQSVYCRAEWELPHYKTARHFWSDVIPRLLHLGAPDDVRIVFWFDN